MTQPVYQPLDLLGNQLVNFRVENLGSAPSAGNAGRLIFNTATSKLLVDLGGSVVPLLDTEVQWNTIVGRPTTFPPEAHSHVVGDVTGLQGQLDDLAPLASPVFTGTPTAPTAAANTNTTQVATTAFVINAVGNAGGGDMLKSAYDTDDNGKVDVAELAEAVAWANVTGKPTSFPPDSHNHPISQVTGLQAALDNKSNTGHSHVIADVASLQSTLDGKANTSHSHAISEVSGLTSALNDKADDNHGHVAADISDFTTSVRNEVVAYWDSIAGADGGVDTIREVLDLVLASADAVAEQIGRHEADIGDGSASTHDVTHSLNSLDVSVEVYEKSSGETVVTGVRRIDANTVRITATPVFGTATHRVIVKR